MHAEDRLIHFSTELIHAPLQHRVAALQKLYFDLSQTRFTYESTEFSAPPQFKFYSRRGANTQSLAIFLPDRIALVEEWVDVALSDFCDRVTEVSRRTCAELNIPTLVAQTVTLRSTFALTHHDDARVFLLDRACSQAGLIGPHFRRPIAVGGLRFVLPETSETPYALHVVIESFRHSISEVFVEVKGVFANQQIGADNSAQLSANIQAVRTFITDSIYPYLEQFDVPEETEA